MEEGRGEASDKTVYKTVGEDIGRYDTYEITSDIYVDWPNRTIGLGPDQTVGLGPDRTGLLNQQSGPKIKDRP